MAYTEGLGQSDAFRREELIRMINHFVENLTLQELEALYYDMSTKKLAGRCLRVFHFHNSPRPTSLPSM